jgi:hypothetical protein
VSDIVATAMLVRRVVNEWRFRMCKKPLFDPLCRPTLPITLSEQTSARIQKNTV